jgi:hypothetical protein
MSWTQAWTGPDPDIFSGCCKMIASYTGTCKQEMVEQKTFLISLLHLSINNITDYISL